MNQALVLKSFQLRTSDGKHQYLYLLGLTLRFNQNRETDYYILDSVLLSLAVPNGTDNDVKGEGLHNLIEDLEDWR